MTVPAQAPLRDRLVERAAAVTGADGWSAVTMGRLARDVGVSRQTVYNEVGDKQALGEAVIRRELDLFIDAVEESLLGVDDAVDAVRRTVRTVLDRASGNPLLHAIMSASHGTHSELLPLLSIRSAFLLDASVETLLPHLLRLAADVDPERLQHTAELVARLVLSYTIQPSEPPGWVADEIAAMVRAVLADARGTAQGWSSPPSDMPSSSSSSSVGP